MTQFRDNLHVTNVASSDQQGDFLGSQSEMPAPSVYNVGCTVYYTGVAGTYNPGQFYTCVQDGATYKWEAANVISTGFRQGTADRALMTDASGYAVASGVTGTELGYLGGVTGGIQGQLNGKVPVSRKVNGKTLENDITLGYADVGAAPVAGTLDVNRALQSNGSGEVTVSNVTAVELSYLSGVTSAIQTQLNGKADIDDVPTLLSELTNDTGFITNAVTDLVNYYVKGDTYTKTEVNSLVSAIPKFSIQVVQSLPSSNISTTTIYLTPSGGAAGNVYNEFIYVNNTWEQIGSTAVDLSDYYDKATVNTMVTPVQSASGITINGVALQAATASQQGLMTTAQVGNLSTAMTNAQNALNGNVTGGTLSTDASGNMTLTLNRGAGALNITANGITAAKAIADGNGANIASTYATIGALNSGLAGKANANTAITGGAFSDNLLTLNRGVGDIQIPINASGSEGSIPVENYGQEWLPEYKSVQMTCDFSTTLSYTSSIPFIKIHDTVFPATTSQSSDKIYFDKNQNRMVRCKYTSINSISLKESDYDEFTPCRYYRVFEPGSQYNSLLSAILTAFSGVPFYRHMTFNIGLMCLYCEEEQCAIMTPSLNYPASSPYELSFDTSYNLQVCGYNRNLSLEGSFEFEICGYISGGYPTCPAFPARIVSAIPQDYAELHNLSN